MTSRFVDLERKTLLVQYVAVQSLTFYSTSDGTDLVQDILRSQLARSDADIIGQEGSLSIDDYGEFLAFEPGDVKNQNLHLPIEHLAYCGALRRLRRDTTDRRESDQLPQREFENVDLANRFPHLIVGPPIFVAVFHGFDNALCYTFVTQSPDDACLLVMKLMRAFKMHEQQLEQQGQIQQGPAPLPPQHRSGSSSPVRMRQRSPFAQSTQPFVTDHRSIGISPADYMQRLTSTGNSYHQDPRQDDIIQRLLSNPNLQLVNEPTSYSSQRYDNRARPPASSPMVSLENSSCSVPIEAFISPGYELATGESYLRTCHCVFERKSITEHFPCPLSSFFSVIISKHDILSGSKRLRM